MSIIRALKEIKQELPEEVTLVAVSKTKPIDQIMQAYEAGQRHFGENRVQELVQKHAELPKDIKWHQIGHLQSNKVKYIIPFVHLIHAVDSEKLLFEINRQAQKHNRVAAILLQLHIARESSKFGFEMNALEALIEKGIFQTCSNVQVKGLMGMATFTHDQNLIKEEFKTLKNCFELFKFRFDENFDTLSMGMSGDYELAIQEGSTMVRVGSKIFGAR